MASLRVFGVTSLLCGLSLLACVSTASADPKPLTKEEQAKVDEAIDKGVAFLKSVQTREGSFRFSRYEASHAVGTCALPAYALLESGVPANDPVIEKAAKYLRATALLCERTYDLSLALLFFDRLGDPQDKKLIQAIALHLIAAQRQSGGWTYNCGNDKCGVEAYPVLFNRLQELNKRRKDGRLTRDQALQGMEVPPRLSLLTVFQRSNQLSWEEDSNGRTFLVGITDNSNTQFALLGLWAARRHGVPVEPTLEIAVERFERLHVYPAGHWMYSTYLQRDFNPITRASMTCVGLMGLAMGRALKLPTPGSPAAKDKDIHVLRGLSALSRMIGKPHGDMAKKRTLQDLYFLWSIERVAMLYDLQTIGDKDWYRWGVEVLVSNQQKSGWWPGWGMAARGERGDMSNYGAALNTAFALLFLKRSHPMKDLTPKLPFKPNELNQGIASLRPRDKYPLRTITTSGPSNKDAP